METSMLIFQTIQKRSQRVLYYQMEINLFKNKICCAFTVCKKYFANTTVSHAYNERPTGWESST